MFWNRLFTATGFLADLVYLIAALYIARRAYKHLRLPRDPRFWREFLSLIAMIGLCVGLAWGFFAGIAENSPGQIAGASLVVLAAVLHAAMVWLNLGANSLGDVHAAAIVLALAAYNFAVSGDTVVFRSVERSMEHVSEGLGGLIELTELTEALTQQVRDLAEVQGNTLKELTALKQRVTADANEWKPVTIDTPATFEEVTRLRSGTTMLLKSFTNNENSEPRSVSLHYRVFDSTGEVIFTGHLGEYEVTVGRHDFRCVITIPNDTVDRLARIEMLVN